MLRVFILIVLSATMLPVSLWSQAVPVKHAHVELISQKASIAPGHDVKLGVHFTLEKGWHIYWINPGDSGQPPTLQWQLPTGLSAGEIEWPRPDKMQSSPTLADYGYHDDVLLMVPVKVSSDSLPHELNVSVQAKWLICREVCIPDHAELKTTLTAGKGEADSKSSALFAKAEKQLPNAWPKGWSANVQAREDDFLLTINTGKPISKAEFYPLERGQIENAAPQRVKPTPRGCVMVLKKSDLLLKSIASLRGLLILRDGQAYQLDAPLAPASIQPGQH